MIDKTKVLAEIERLKIEKRKGNLPFHALYYDGYEAACDKIIDYLNSIPVEKQPSGDLENAATVLTNEIVGELNAGDYTDHSGHEDLVCKADEIARKWKACGLPYKAICDAVVEMAIWQKQQMLKSAIEGCWIKRNRYTKENVLNGLSVTCDAIQKFRDGDKVRVLILKDDEQ